MVVSKKYAHSILYKKTHLNCTQKKQIRGKIKKFPVCICMDIKNIETTCIQQHLDAMDLQKVIEILSSGICAYLSANKKTNKAAAKRAAKALKTARELTIKCSEIPSENDLLSGGDESIL